MPIIQQKPYSASLTFQCQNDFIFFHFFVRRPSVRWKAKPRDLRVKARNRKRWTGWGSWCIGGCWLGSKTAGFSWETSTALTSKATSFSKTPSSIGALAGRRLLRWNSAASASFLSPPLLARRVTWTARSKSSCPSSQFNFCSDTWGFCILIQLCFFCFLGCISLCWRIDNWVWIQT